MNKNNKVLILGARGLVGSALVRVLEGKGYKNILKPLRDELDLLNQSAVKNYFKENEPDVVVLAAAKVGGIVANNTYRADFILENLGIQQNVITSCLENNVDEFLFLGSSCIYPKESKQPIKEEYLLTSSLEQTNEPYAIAKIAGLKSTESINRQYGKNYLSVMPTNLYGENDNFDLNNSHVIPGLIARMLKAKKNNEDAFKIWGTGKPRREFLYVDDLARACIFLLEQNKSLPPLINIGYGDDIEIGELAKIIAKEVNYQGELTFDSSKPDGTMRKLLDSTKIRDLGWKPEVDIETGIKKTVDFYVKNYL